ncbi:hypothetical protein D9M68_497570 [compost metagenome]
MNLAATSLVADSTTALGLSFASSAARSAASEPSFLMATLPTILSPRSAMNFCVLSIAERAPGLSLCAKAMRDRPMVNRWFTMRLYSSSKLMRTGKPNSLNFTTGPAPV